MPGVSGALQCLNRFRAAHAALAMQDCIARGINLIHAANYLSERDQCRPRQPRNLVLVWLAHVYHLNVVTAIEPAFEFSGADFFELWWFHLLPGRESTKLFIIDQLFDSRVLAAHGAI